MFSNRNSYYWLAQLGGWGFYILLYTFFYYSTTYYYSEHKFYFQTVYTEALTGLMVSHLMRRVIKDFKILQLPIGRQILWIALITLAFALLYSSLVVTIESFFGWELEYFIGTSFFYKWSRTSLGAGLFFTIWSLLYISYHYMRTTQSERLDQVRLEGLVKELELKTLKSSINPHFIFNALNSIRALIDENPSRARTAITELSHLLRSSMSMEKEELVPLEQELKIVQNYLSLEQIRFEERLKVTFDIDEDTLGQKVPPMMLQTIAENAIKHGISKLKNGGEVEIISDFVDDHHELIVRNTGQLYNENATPGFGLISTRQRIQWLYGGRGKFTIYNTAQKKVEVKMELPITL